MIRFLQSLGRIETRLKNYDEARKSYEQALTKTNKFLFKSIEYELHESLTEVFALKGEYKEAYEHYKKYHEVKEEVVNMQSSTRMKSIQFMNQIELAKREAELQKEKHNEIQKAYSIIEEKIRI